MNKQKISTEIQEALAAEFFSQRKLTYSSLICKVSNHSHVMITGSLSVGKRESKIFSVAELTLPQEGK